MQTPISPGRPWMNGLLRLLLSLRNRHFLALDALTALLTPTLALWLRTDGADLARDGRSVIIVTVVFLCVKLAVFFPAGFYRRYWRYASIDELTLIAAGALLATCLLYTSDAADERSSVDLGGRRIIKKKKKTQDCAR